VTPSFLKFAQHESIRSEQKWHILFCASDKQKSSALAEKSRDASYYLSVSLRKNKWKWISGELQLNKLSFSLHT